MIVSENQIYNLMDTNGRRNDVTNALRGYLIILEEIMKYRCSTWDRMPNSLSQFYFYESTLKMFPDVFKKHEPYDLLIKRLNDNEKFRIALESNDIELIREHYTDYFDLVSLFDKGIEDRARHYTSNLVKLGFVDSNRVISDVGRMIVDTLLVKKDKLEKIIPLDETNIIYFRQLLKLRIYNNEKNRYYSPFCLALYMLMKKERVSESDFFNVIQGLSPYDDLSIIDGLIDDSNANLFEKETNVIVPDIVRNNDKIKKESFCSIFFNKKSALTIESYWGFYEAIYDFSKQKNEQNLIKLLSIYSENKNYINKAFGNGVSLFYLDQSNVKIDVEKFVKENERIFGQNNINEVLYQMFAVSKYFDGITEYSDTTKRIFNATGVISFNNGFVQLAYKELIEKIVDANILKLMIGGVVKKDDIDYTDYEIGINSYYCSAHSTIEILKYDEQKVNDIIGTIKETFNELDVDNIINTIKEKRKKEFEDYIEEKYPIDVVKRLLSMFADRSKDDELKRIVSEVASVPTIYEYIVGIAWYYFSNKTINLLNSYNLSLSANFETLVHAGGGQGDIVIKTNDKVVMLEVSLMNASAQKRGEWEPVLRHSVNLKVAEETSGKNREVTTFFISDDFDNNTINIWKAIASAPIESTNEKNKYTYNVVIMPINNNELSTLMDMRDKYNGIISRVHDLFEIKANNFDMNWRDNFINKLYVEQ